MGQVFISPFKGEESEVREAGEQGPRLLLGQLRAPAVSHPFLLLFSLGSLFSEKPPAVHLQLGTFGFMLIFFFCFSCFSFKEASSSYS